MSRIKIPKPNRIDFTTILKLRIYDMNYGGHMGNDIVLRLVHEARLRFLNSIGVNEQDFFGVSLLISDSAVVYKNQAFYTDAISINITVLDVSDYTFILVYILKNEKKNLEIARVKTSLVCYNHLIKKLTKIPFDFTSIFA